MPKLYDYFGLTLFFYSNEHEPIHVHATRDGLENKIEIDLREGRIVSLKVKAVSGRKALSAADQKKFKKLVAVLAEEIVQSWVNYFIYHRTIIPKSITKKL